MIRRTLILGAATAAAIGGFILLAPSAPLQLPDGGTFDGSYFAFYIPDGGAVISAPGCTWCTVATPNGYVEQQVQWTDAGPIFASTRAFSCWCASDAGACTLPDGGPAPRTGTMDPAIFGVPTGPGCLRRACMENSSDPGTTSWTGAPPGCAP